MMGRLSLRARTTLLTAVVYSTDGSIFYATDLDIEIDGLLETVDGYGQPTDVSLPAAVTRDADNLRAMVIVVDFGVWVDGGVPDSGEPVGPLAPDDFIIYVGTSLDGVDRTVDAATKGVLIVGPTLIGVVGLLTWLFASRAPATVRV